MDTLALMNVCQVTELIVSFRKVNQSAFSISVVITLLMELSIGNENCSLPLCVYVVGFANPVTTGSQ